MIKNSIICIKRNREQGKATVLIGTQLGDEGKGKIVDTISEKFDLVCRAQGGSNAGHTVVVDKLKYSFHVLPSGILRDNCHVVIGNGVIIHLPSLMIEIIRIEERLGKDIKSRLFISDRSHIVFDFHKIIDRLGDARKGSLGIGTSGKGIGPTYASKVSRTGLRICDLMSDFAEFKNRAKFMFDEYKQHCPMFVHNFDQEMEYLEKIREIIRPRVVDTAVMVNGAILSGKNVLVEGANAHMLDVDFGTYPYVTSSNTGVGGICTGLGIPPSRIGPVVGVMKAYTTRLGKGPFPTELKDELGELLCAAGSEYGTTTGRKRRCGWLDLVMVRSCDLITDIKYICITKLDVLDSMKEIKVAISYTTEDGMEIRHYPANLKVLKNITVNYVTLNGWLTSTRELKVRAELPLEARMFVEFIEHELGKPVLSIGVGFQRNDLIY